ncbi:hypothetical protein M2163_000322 [Streptomyces sp. SAI-135]|jgi:hypothetical protein|nr:hypothetical protein [Streptomyces sp. SAI-090]MDH6554785.1 hypothetical protein [Streptomyces sp. SAI-041]MDH6574057.1 hypothetical protein [Streptomyces sp. SAI-117]MDH6581207.1 hypothetical protein [Streptomyces sp. SAI-133]MDH6613214.1 hypothetical protein [Streptomyces sp. SAI-135]
MTQQRDEIAMPPSAIASAIGYSNNPTASMSARQPFVPLCKPDSG